MLDMPQIPEFITEIRKLKEAKSKMSELKETNSLIETIITELQKKADKCVEIASREPINIGLLSEVYNSYYRERLQVLLDIQQEYNPERIVKVINMDTQILESITLK